MIELRAVLGTAAGFAALGSLTFGAVALRRRFLPSVHGPPGWLADLIAVVAATVTISEALGTVHLFRPGVLTAVLVACGGAAWYVGRHGAGAAPVEPAPPADVPNRTGRVVMGVAIGAAGVVIAAWVPRLIQVFRTGPLTIDSMWYHLPIAARFAQTGSTLGLTFVSGGDSLPTYYPHSSELLHAVGIVFLGNDTLTPLLNVLWLVVALFSAWCIGRAFGVAPLTFTGVAVILGGPQLVMYEAGQGINDLFGVAMTLAAMSMLVYTWRGAHLPAGVVYAGLAMGLAVGSKLTAVGPAAALTIVLVAFLPRGRRVRLGALWVAALVLTGGFWFVRNLVAVGNPVPPVNVSIGPIQLPSLHAVGVSTVWSHLFTGDRWSRDFFPGFRYALGPAWWAVLAIVLGGLVVGVVRRGIDQRIRLIAVVGALSVLVYLFTPQALGLFGNAGFFRYNVRYLAIALVLGATVLTLVVSRAGPRVKNATAIVFAVVLLASQFDAKLWPFDGARPPELGLPVLSRTELALGIGAGLLAVAFGAGVVWWGRARVRTARRSSVVIAAVVGTVIVVGGLFALQHVYLGRRYTNSPYFTKTYRWARDHHGLRVGLVGTFLQYPLTGNRVANRELFLDARTRDLEKAKTFGDCATWRRTVNRQRLDYVVVTTLGFPAGAVPSPERTWTDGEPAARLVLTDRSGPARAWLYRLDGRLDPATCPVAPAARPAG